MGNVMSSVYVAPDWWMWQIWAASTVPPRPAHDGGAALAGQPARAANVSPAAAIRKRIVVLSFNNKCPHTKKALSPHEVIAVSVPGVTARDGKHMPRPDCRHPDRYGRRLRPALRCRVSAVFGAKRRDPPARRG